jgi:hypothetical protein
MTSINSPEIDETHLADEKIKEQLKKDLEYIFS